MKGQLMLESQIEMIDRKRVLENERKLREEQGSTFLAQTTNDTGGRFAQIGAAHVVGSTAIPQYPQASTPFQSDPVGLEPPLGLDNPALEPLELPVAQGNSGEPASDPAPSPPPGDVERRDVGSPLSRTYRRY
jgi:hypothetical protein